ncbi:MAG: hypothetical protein WAU07_00380 [Microgenomates group bacterium]
MVLALKDKEGVSSHEKHDGAHPLTAERYELPRDLVHAAIHTVREYFHTVEPKFTSRAFKTRLFRGHATERRKRTAEVTELVAAILENLRKTFPDARIDRNIEKKLFTISRQLLDQGLSAEFIEFAVLRRYANPASPLVMETLVREMMVQEEFAPNSLRILNMLLLLVMLMTLLGACSPATHEQVQSDPGGSGIVDAYTHEVVSTPDVPLSIMGGALRLANGLEITIDQSTIGDDYAALEEFIAGSANKMLFYVPMGLVPLPVAGTSGISVSAKEVVLAGGSVITLFAVSATEDLDFAETIENIKLQNPALSGYRFLTLGEFKALSFERGQGGLKLMGTPLDAVPNPELLNDLPPLTLSSGIEIESHLSAILGEIDINLSEPSLLRRDILMQNFNGISIDPDLLELELDLNKYGLNMEEYKIESAVIGGVVFIESSSSYRPEFDKSISEEARRALILAKDRIQAGRMSEDEFQRLLGTFRTLPNFQKHPDTHAYTDESLLAYVERCLEMESTYWHLYNEHLIVEEDLERLLTELLGEVGAILEGWTNVESTRLEWLINNLDFNRMMQIYNRVKSLQNQYSRRGLSAEYLEMFSEKLNKLLEIITSMWP